MIHRVRQMATLARPAVVYLAFAAVVALTAELVLEAARTGWSWAYVSELLSRDTGVVLVGALVILLATGFLLAVTGHMWLTATLVLSTTLVLGTASHLKFVVRREPIYPSDLVFAGEPGFLLEMVDPGALWLTVAGLVPVVLFSWVLSRLFTTWLRRRTPKPATRWHTTALAPRAAVAVLALALLWPLGSFHNANSPWRATFESAGADWAKASQARNYRMNGFLGGFFYNLDVTAMARPPGYSKTTMERIESRYVALAQEGYGDGDPDALEDVNVVTILEETFSDPTRPAGMRLAEDPTPRTRALMEGLPHGLALAQKIGAGTSSMEFEALTGMSLAQFSPTMDTPYQMLVPEHRHFPSAAELFSQLGHDTVAIHPFGPAIYQRDRVYPILGFDEFISREGMDFGGRIENNPYISDRGAFRQTLEVISDHEAPVFVNLVTMQNHFPYAGHYPDPVGVEGLGEEHAERVGQYVRGLAHTDRAISRLITALERSDEKTVVVLYGDHLPPGLPGEIYAANSDRVMHETPFFIYANFAPLGDDTLPTTSPIFFLPQVFELLDAPMPPYYALLNELRQNVSAMQHGRMVSHWDYDLEPESLTPDAQALLRDYRLVQYDLAVGQRYAESMFYPLPAERLEASAARE